MKSQSFAKIFNSTQRRVEETASYRSFGALSEPLNELMFFNNAFLAPDESITYKHEEHTRVVILPLAGALSYSNEIYNEEEFVKSEQVKIIEVAKGLPYTFSNPFEKEWINYLHIGFRITSSAAKQPSVLRNIELNKMDKLACFDIDKQQQAVGYIGIYNGRSEDKYILRNSENGIFVYVVNGAFEVHGRLLEYMDGLSLLNTEEIEFEALSNNAIIMILEIK